MPIPLLLAGAAAAAGAIGAMGHKEAKETNERAQRMCDDAQELYENSKRAFETSRNEMEKSLLKLGNTKKDILYSSMSQFIESYGRVKDIKFEESIGLDEISNLRISSQDIVELVNMSNIYDSTIKSGAAGAATGAIITLAASGSLPIITSTLGAAGTALAIGEVGMAASLAGSAISLGAAMTPLTAIAAPVVMFTGISASIKADENLEKARVMYSKATAASEEMKISQTLYEAISERSYMFDTLLIELDKIFSGCTELLDGVTRRKRGIFKNKKVSYNNLTPEEKKLLMVTGSLAKAVKTIIDTPIVNGNNISLESEEVYNDIKEGLPQLIHNGTEVKSLDYGVKAKSCTNTNTNKKSKLNITSILKFILGSIGVVGGYYFSRLINRFETNKFGFKNITYLVENFSYYSIIGFFIYQFIEIVVISIVTLYGGDWLIEKLGQETLIQIFGLIILFNVYIKAFMNIIKFIFYNKKIKATRLQGKVFKEKFFCLLRLIIGFIILVGMYDFIGIHIL